MAAGKGAERVRKEEEKLERELDGLQRMYSMFFSGKWRNYALSSRLGG